MRANCISNMTWRQVPIVFANHARVGMPKCLSDDGQAHFAAGALILTASFNNNVDRRRRDQSTSRVRTHRRYSVGTRWCFLGNMEGKSQCRPCYRLYGRNTEWVVRNDGNPARKGT
jgi:hypothetical protein